MHIYLRVYICTFTIVVARAHVYSLYIRVCTGYRRGKIGNWRGWASGGKVVGGNKALGTALLRSLIWRTRVCAISPTRSAICMSNGSLNSRERRYAIIRPYRVMTVKGGANRDLRRQFSLKSLLPNNYNNF